MLALLQRVKHARVSVDGAVVAAIGPGLCVFAGFGRKDDSGQVQRMCKRILGYRVFADHQGRMNLSLEDVDGGLLVVPNFTLTADTRKGSRASFTPAADPELAGQLFVDLITALEHKYNKTKAGIFAADMQVELLNDGPVTFLLECSPPT